ncbi:MAG: serine hydrolase [Candidatus Bathyarchaeota archaeon B24]|nr:MAG: serine hydrolase [Candidatus Bathyarchaeota archaeon B24]
MRRYLHRDEEEMETLRPGTPSDAGLKEDYVSKALNVLEDGLRGGVYPGFTVLVARKGVVAIHRADGYAQLIPERRPMGLNTVFDLASLTKPVCTATLTLKMVEKGALTLETRVCEVLDGWDEGWRSKVTIRHLLTHTSGLPAWIPLYRKCRGKAEYLRAINRVEKAYEPGSKTVYSDLGFMVLGFILEEASSSTLDTLSRREIFKPLGMTETCFNPAGEVKARAAATEKCPWRGRVVVGEVHDENAYALGGVAGHAGLFSTAYDLAVFCQTMLNMGVYGSVRLLEEETVEEATRTWVRDADKGFGLGWMKPLTWPLSESSYGHTGFTGTSVWICPRLELFAVLLTNRIHPSRRNPPCKRISSVRTAFHRLLAKSAEG